MGILADLTERTQSDFDRIRRELTRLADTDPVRSELEEQHAELVLLISDIEHRLMSPRVLEATAQMRHGRAA